MECFKETPVLTLPLLVQLLGSHPESGEEVLVCIGPYGPFIRWQGISASIPKVSSHAFEG